MWGRDKREKFKSYKKNESVIGNADMKGKCFRCLKKIIDGRMLKGNKYCEECFDIIEGVLKK